MRKIYAPSFTGKSYLFLLLAAFSAFFAKAQVDVPIGTGTTGNANTTYPVPMQDYFEGSRAQYLYRASELIAAGMGPGNINAVKFNVTALNSFSGDIEQFTIKVGGTAVATLSTTTWESGTTTAYGPVNYVPVTGINTFTLSTPFFWDGTSNLIIETCNGLPANVTDGLQHWSGNVTVPWTTGLAFNGSHTYRADDEGNLCGTTLTTSTTQTTRPNIIFNWTPASACSGTPNAGTATTSAASVCLGEAFTLSLSGATVASGLSYQWQSSPDGTTNWTNISGATMPSFIATQTATTYYRAVVTCASGGAPATSTVVQVTSPLLVNGTFVIDKVLGTNIALRRFGSFNEAYNYIKCGINGPVVFNVAAGTGPYTEQLIMAPVPGASSTNTVTFNGNGETIQYLSTNTNERAVIKLNGADFIGFNNLVITATGSGTSDYGFGVQLINDADSNRITNCKININTASTSANFAGIVMNASATSATTTGSTLCDGNLIDNNVITGGYYGITLVGSTTEAVRQNVVTNNTVQEFYYYGIYLVGNFNTQVENNRITRPTRTAVTTFVYGIYVNSLNTLLNITRNRIYNPYGGATTNTGTFYGIYFTGTDALSGLENKVTNNAIYNTNFNGSIYGLYNLSSDNVWYYHNTVVIDGTTTTSGAFARGFYQTSAAGGIDIRNNIFYISRGGTSTNHLLYFATTIGTTNPFVSNYNDLVLTTTTGTNFVGFYNAANKATLLDWQTASAQDANSLTVNPIFQAPAGENYAPTNASLNDKGTPLNVSVDINNSPRNAAAPDMGAWEFSPGACVVPPTAGTAAASTNPVCTGFPVSLTLNGNTIGLGQTYTLQSAVNIGGSYSDVGVPRTLADTVIRPTTTLYYRFAVTCGSSTVYSAPVLVSVNQRMPGGTYTIDKNSPTNYPTGTNFVSFNAANNALQCGIDGAVVFNVTAGRTTYNEQLIIDTIPGASAVNTVTFNGNGNTIKFHSSNNDERAVIKLRRADFVTVDSLNIDATGTNTYGWGVQLVNNADSNTVRRCNITTSVASTSTNDAGIVVSSSENSATTAGTTWCDGNLFERNTITGGYYGITLVGNTTGTDILQNNTVRGNVIKDFYFYGMYLYGNNNLTVEGNDISRPTRTATSTFYGIYATTYGTNLLVSKNRIHNPFDGTPATTSGFYGIYFTSVDGLSAASPNRIINNAIYNVNGEGDEYGYYNSSSDYTLFYHNTLSFDNTASTHTTTWWTRPVYQITSAVGLEYKNNIISIRRGGAGDRHAMYMASGGTFVSNNNDLYVTGNAGATFTGYYNAGITTLAAWQTVTGQDGASYAVNPRYRNAATGDLYPLESTLDNKGTPVGVGTDILNVSRNNPPDIGAWEFAIPACTAPPAAGTAVASPNVGICKGYPIALTLTGINTVVAGQTYQWQYSTSAGGPWTNLGGPLSYPDTTIEASRSYYYRAVVTCSGQSANSATALVTLNPSLLGGYYTINPAGTGTNNFTSFTAAAAALACGIEDDVWFAAVPGTYTEQIRIGKIAGASDTARVTFMSQNGNPASVILTYGASAANNYTLKLDSSSFVTFRDMTINASDATNGRAIDVAGTSGSDSLTNLVINVPVTTNTGTTVIGIFGNTTNTGQKNVMRRNTINNGTAGIYYAGSGAAQGNKIDSNTVNNPYYYGIYFTNSAFSSLNNNTVNRTAPTNTTAYSIYAINLDSAYEVVGNRVNSAGLTVTQYGMYLSGLDANTTLQGRIANNRITVTGATGTVYGMYQTGNTFNYSLNNVISVTTTGSSYALYSTGGGDLKYYNNSVNNASTGTTNYAGYLVHTTGSGADMRNNIFANNGGGLALYNSNPGYVTSDYNMYYTSGATLFQQVSPAAGTFTTLNAWIVASGWDQNSILYKPAFNSNTDLSPKLNDSTVWAMHGRGVQIVGNNADINNASRPTTLTTGVPDLGAFEFLPTVPPMPLQGIPATPTANTTQVFMFGTDTVAKIGWKATVPSSIALRRYSGVLPTGTTASQRSMYFYTKADVTGTSTPNYDLKQFYIDPWQGFIPREAVTRLGRTNAAGSWLVDAASRVDTIANVISRDTLNYIDRFTGLNDTTIAPPPPPVYVQQVDSSNRGKRFWVAYANSYDFQNGNSQDMVLYFGAGSQPANVTVRIMGTTWVRTYTVPANTAITSAFIPKVGINDARLVSEGQSPKGILIESDVPISAYAHIYASANSGATMLLPVGVYGYEYYTLNTRQFYTTTSSYSTFIVVADRDNTKVEITPSNPTLAGKPAGVPFTVTLNAGETYQVLGAYISGIEGYDLTGSLVKSVPNSAGKCYPIAVFAGSSRTYITCGGAGSASGGDLIFQQVFPSQAWGTRYLTAPTSTDASASTLMGNVYRVMVKDPTTVVQRNGVTLTGLVGNRYYQFESGTGDYITADKPIMVAQYEPSSGGGCANTGGNGDPEMFYLSPIEQAVKETQFYRNDQSAITVNYVTLIIPTAGVSSLLIDGSATFDYTYPHPNRPGYTVVVKRYAAGTGFSTAKSDSAFTGIVYGLGSVESYGYNAGTLVKNLNALPSITNTLGTTGTSSYTCTNTPFRFYILLPLKPTQLTWQFSQVQGLAPNTDVTQNNPAVLDSTLINGRWYYRFTVAADYTFSGTGNFNVPIIISHPSIEGCSNSFERLLTISVVAAPVTDFSVTFTGCLGDVAQFAGSGATTVPGVSTTAYNWNFGDNTTGTGQSVNHTYTAPGTFNTKLNVITADGCLGEKTKPVVVNPRPTVTLVSDSVTTCPGVAVVLQVQSPVTGVTYNWYTAATGGTPVFTGTTYNATVSTQTVFYVEAVQAGCSSTSRRRAVVAILPNLPAPVVQVINAQLTPSSITWGWTAVPNATGYQVSTDNGTTWTAPSSGAGIAALTHTVTGLRPLTSVTLLVRALGGCQEARSAPVTGKTLTDQVYIPNSFSPNGDGLNDRLMVYGYVIKSMQFTVFNQWGEKIFESRSQQTGWDGTYKGQMQPSGVYIYVAKFTLNDGSTTNMKGTINLVR